jgi:hypothetical protein
VIYTIVRTLCILLAATVSESDTVQINISLPFMILAMTFHNKMLCVFQVSPMGEGEFLHELHGTTFSLFLFVSLFLYIYIYIYIYRALRGKPEGRGFETRYGDFFDFPDPFSRTRSWDSLSV